jgi:hypothetical protein
MIAIALIAFFVMVVAWLVAPAAKTPAPVPAETLPFGSAAGVAD